MDEFVLPRGGLSYLRIVLSRSLTIFIILGMLICLVYMTWAGIQMIAAVGDKNKVAAARARLTWAATGLIVIMISSFIVNSIGYLFKVDLLKLGL